jgi:hypothetical protein
MAARVRSRPPAPGSRLKALPVFGWVRTTICAFAARGCRERQKGECDRCRPLRNVHAVQGHAGNVARASSPGRLDADSETYSHSDGYTSARRIPEGARLTEVAPPIWRARFARGTSDLTSGGVSSSCSSACSGRGGKYDGEEPKTHGRGVHARDRYPWHEDSIERLFLQEWNAALVAPGKKDHRERNERSGDEHEQ